MGWDFLKNNHSVFHQYFSFAKIVFYFFYSHKMKFKFKYLNPKRIYCIYWLFIQKWSSFLNFFNSFLQCLDVKSFLCNSTVDYSWYSRSYYLLTKFYLLFLINRSKLQMVPIPILDLNFKVELINRIHNLWFDWLFN